MTDSSGLSAVPCDLVGRVGAALSAAGVRQTRLVVAVSGGADSTALLRLAAELQSELELQLTVAHLDHALRADSASDAEWVASLCRELRVPFQTQRITPRADAGHVSEETARNWRRTFLADMASQAGAQWVATAHSRDDQAETVLHRLLRGTGPRGLAGMAFVAPLGAGVKFVRPLLDVSRRALEEWLQSRGQPWLTDVTNIDARYTRNRIRHQLLPMLRDDFNPQVDAALCRLAKQSRALTDWLRAAADEALDAELLERTPELIRLAIDRPPPRPRVLWREIFVRVWQRQGWKEQGMTGDHWEQLAAAALSTESTQRFQLPGGIDVQREGRILRLRRTDRGGD